MMLSSTECFLIHLCLDVFITIYLSVWFIQFDKLFYFFLVFLVLMQHRVSKVLHIKQHILIQIFGIFDSFILDDFGQSRVLLFFFDSSKLSRYALGNGDLSILPDDALNLAWTRGTFNVSTLEGLLSGDRDIWKMKLSMWRCAVLVLITSAV